MDRRTFMKAVIGATVAPLCLTQVKKNRLWYGKETDQREVYEEIDIDYQPVPNPKVDWKNHGASSQPPLKEQVHYAIVMEWPDQQTKSNIQNAPLKVVRYVGGGILPKGSVVYYTDNSHKKVRLLSQNARLKKGEYCGHGIVKESFVPPEWVENDAGQIYYKRQPVDVDHLFATTEEKA